MMQEVHQGEILTSATVEGREGSRIGKAKQVSCALRLAPGSFRTILSCGGGAMALYSWMNQLVDAGWPREATLVS